MEPSLKILGPEKLFLKTLCIVGFGHARAAFAWFPPPLWGDLTFQSHVFYGGTSSFRKKMGGPYPSGGTWVKMPFSGGTYIHHLQNYFSPYQSHWHTRIIMTKKFKSVILVDSMVMEFQNFLQPWWRCCDNLIMVRTKNKELVPRTKNLRMSSTL